MNDETNEKIQKKKNNGLFTLFACIMTGIIVFLATNLGNKASEVVEPNTKVSNRSEETSNIGTMESNSNSSIDSNSNNIIDSNSNSNISSNQQTESNVTNNTEKNINVELKKSSNNGYATANVIATENGKQLWNYNTDKYSETELEPFTIYQGSKYVYLSEGGNLRALSKDTGKVVWKNDSKLGYGIIFAELNDKLYASGYYNNDINIIDTNTGKIIKTVPITDYHWPTKMEVKDNSTLIITCSENNNDSSNYAQVEFNVNTYTITK